MTDTGRVWKKITPKTEPKMDLRRAKALLRMKERIDPADILKRLALAEEISKIPPEMIDQAFVQLAQEADGPQQESAPQGTADDLDFQQLRVAFRDYEVAKTQQEVLERLNVFHLKTVDWLNSHRSSKKPIDVERVGALSELTDWAEKEMVAVAGAQAEQIYMDDVTASGASKFPLQAITKKSANSVQDKIAGKGDQHGLTEAQRTAFRIFTGPDYGYINPATVVNRKWLEANKSGKYTGAAFVDPRGKGDKAQLDKDRMSEGTLHAGMLDRAMKQLPPYKGTVYRGLAVDLDELGAWTVSKEVVFGTMTSTSKKEATARKFAAENTKPEKPIQLVYIIPDSGGRDISEFSQYKVEDEIMVPAGTRFTVSDIKPKPVTGKDGKPTFPAKKYDMRLTR